MGKRIAAKITGVAGYVPPRVVTNSDLEKIVDTSDEWIRTRTGIRERHYAEPGVASSHLGTEAAKKLLVAKGIGADEIELIVGEGQIGGIADLEADTHAGVTCIFLGDAHERPADIDTGHRTVGQARQFDGEIARPRGDLEYASAGVQLCGDPARGLLKFLDVARGLARVPGRHDPLHREALLRFRRRVRHFHLHRVC